MEAGARAGLYIHVPFCRKKCSYCSFYSFAPRAEEVRAYVAALRQQIRQLAQDPAVRALSFATVFFGGGTPSTLPVEALALVLADCRKLFSIKGEAPEITIEVNPGTIDGVGLEQLRRAGFNRLSIGVQSFDDRELRQLGRIHDRGEALATVAAARAAGFANLSLDLMYALPGQGPRGWQETLDRALALVPEHLSLYELTPEEGTVLYRQLEQGLVTLPDEETVLLMMAATDLTLAPSPLGRYEISNFAQAGRQCRHNLIYWHNGPYLGLGPGAVSAFAGQRRATVADLGEYCRRVATGQPVWAEVEQLDQETGFRETVIMGLRLLAGVSVARLHRRFGIDLPTYYGPILEPLLDQGLVTLVAGRLALTARGLPLANRVMAQLV